MEYIVVYQRVFLLIVFVLSTINAGVRPLHIDTANIAFYEVQKYRKALNFELKWLPKDNLVKLSSLSIVPIDSIVFKIETFKDSRESNKYVGVNYTEEVVRYVYSSTDIVSWCKSRLEDLFKYYSLNVSEKNYTHTLSAELCEFNVNERDTYSGRIIILFSLYNQNGHLIWKTPVIGTYENWGHTFEPVNYQETYAGALINLFYKLVANSIEACKIEK